MAALRGSARSVPGIHIRDVLDGIAARHPELISRFGGHAMAAGLSLEERNLDAFARAFDAEVARWRDPAIPSNRVETDGELASDEIALETAQALRDGGPWGQAFPEPCFDGMFAVKNARVVGDKHLKMWVTTADRSRALRRHRLQLQGRRREPAAARRRRAPGVPARHQRIQGRAAPAAARRPRAAMNASASESYSIRDGRSARPRGARAHRRARCLQHGAVSGREQPLRSARGAGRRALHLPGGRAGRRAGRLRRREELRRLGRAQAHVPQAQGARRRHCAGDAGEAARLGARAKDCRWRGWRPAT